MKNSSSKVVFFARDLGTSLVGDDECDGDLLVLSGCDAGNGIINADGDLWKTQRKAGLRFFGNSNLKDFIDLVLPSYLADTEHRLDTAVETSKPVDLQQIFLELTTRLMGQMAYDVSR